ncbi:MAG: phasin family protein [Hyphomicrobiales bacterium]
MMNQFDDFQKIGKETVDVAIKSFGAATKSMQSIATQTADYSKKSFEQSSVMFEKLAGTKTFDKAYEVQTDYAKSAYEDFVSFASKVGELYTTFAKDSLKPYEVLVSKAQSVSK